MCSRNQENVKLRFGDEKKMNVKNKDLYDIEVDGADDDTINDVQGSNLIVNYIIVSEKDRHRRPCLYSSVNFDVTAYGYEVNSNGIAKD